MLGLLSDSQQGRTFCERFAASAAALARLIPSRSNSAMILDLAQSPARGPVHSYFHNYDLSFLEQYATHYRLHDPMADGLLRADGLPLSLEERTASSFGKDAFTGELLPRLGLRHILGLAIRLPGGPVLAVAIQRDASSGGFSSRERELIRLAGPALRDAAVGSLLSEQISALRSDEPRVGARAGALLLDTSGRLLHLDCGAEALLRRSSLRLEQLAQLAELQALAPAGACLLASSG